MIEKGFFSNLSVTKAFLAMVKNAETTEENTYNIDFVFVFKFTAKLPKQLKDK